jgi:hypothetical protein
LKLSALSINSIDCAVEPSSSISNTRIETALSASGIALGQKHG